MLNTLPNGKDVRSLVYFKKTFDHVVLFVTLDKLHGVEDPYRLSAKPKMGQETMKSSQCWRFSGPFLDHLSTRMYARCITNANQIAYYHIVPICDIG